jgi:hypothetical protein
MLRREIVLPRLSLLFLASLVREVKRMLPCKIVFDLLFQIRLRTCEAALNSRVKVHDLLRSAVRPRREDRKRREIVEAIERHGPPPGYQR